MIWNVRFCKYTTFPCNFCFFCFYIYINLNLTIWKYCISLIQRPNYLSLSLVYQYISFKPLKTDGMLTDLVRGGALTGGLNTRFLNTNNVNLTNIFAHGFLSFNRSRISLLYTRFFWTRIARIKRIFFACGSFCVFLYARGFYFDFYMHTDLTDLTLSLRRGAHGGTRDFFEHEIRRRPTDRREVITRI